MGLCFGWVGSYLFRVATKVSLAGRLQASGPPGPPPARAAWPPRPPALCGPLLLHPRGLQSVAWRFQPASRSRRCPRLPSGALAAPLAPTTPHPFNRAPPLHARTRPALLFPALPPSRLAANDVYTPSPFFPPPAVQQMTYVKQLEDYEEAVMRKRLEEMPEAGARPPCFPAAGALSSCLLLGGTGGAGWLGRVRGAASVAQRPQCMWLRAGGVRAGACCPPLRLVVAAPLHNLLPTPSWSLLTSRATCHGLAAAEVERMLGEVEADKEARRSRATGSSGGSSGGPTN